MAWYTSSTCEEGFYEKVKLATCIGELIIKLFAIHFYRCPDVVVIPGIIYGKALGKRGFTRWS
jgi:hypothetical protein